jgi:hypothetical protein
MTTLIDLPGTVRPTCGNTKVATEGILILRGYANFETTTYFVDLLALFLRHCQ